MHFLLIATLIITSVNFILLFIVLCSNYKNIGPKWDAGEIFANIVLSIVPLMNILVLLFLICVVINFSHVFLKNKSRIKKNPELTSYNTLSEIRKFYISDDELYCEEESCDNKYCCKDEHRQYEENPFILFGEFKRDLFEALEILEVNHNKPNISQILLTYEISFIKILSIIKESKKVNNITTDDILSSSKKTIELFISEIQQVLKVTNEIEKETETFTNKRFIEELEEEAIYHQNRHLK